jgi:hypothetical protein
MFVGAEGMFDGFTRCPLGGPLSTVFEQCGSAGKRHRVGTLGCDPVVALGDRFRT